MNIVWIWILALAQAQTFTEERVNEHISTVHKKIEIEQKQREAELQRENDFIQIDEGAKPQKRKGFIERGQAPAKQNNPDLIPDHFDYHAQDPVQDVYGDIESNRSHEELSQREREAFIKEFKRRAKESGVEVEIDPKTLKAIPKK